MIQLSQKQVECIEFINKESNKEIFVYGHCRSGKTFAIITNLVSSISNTETVSLICVNDTKVAKMLVKYDIEPICAELGIKCKFGISNNTVYIGDNAKIHFAFAPYKEVYYPRYENIIIFGKFRLEYKQYLELSRRSDKIILEDNPFDPVNREEIKNNREEWVYTYFVRGILPYKGKNKVPSNAVTFQLNNQENIPISAFDNMSEAFKKHYLNGEFNE